jgi:protein-S-isoprenylcysteine O-methyltransferase Ste14
VIFWIGWLIAAFTAKTSRGSGSSLYSAVRIGLIVVIAIFLRRSWAGPGHHALSDPALAGLGLALWAAGLGLAVWARLYIGRNWGMPMTKKADPELITSGSYHKVRHPIYTGIILAMVGTTIAVSLYWLVAVFVIGAYFIYSAVVEERSMTQLFPDTYPAYQRSTKMLIPFIL